MSGSTLEGKSQRELDKDQERFIGKRGQSQGTAHHGMNHFVPEYIGLYAFAISEDEKN